jgi:hypothetical protein
MADVKISGLPASTTPLAGTEVLPIVQSGVTKKVASDDLTVKNVRSNATTGILQVVGPAAAATRVMTTPDANFTAARIDAAQSFTGDQTLSTGNLVMGTADKGIDFSINSNPAGATSELLNDYEEGTWTPSSVASTVGSITTVGAVSGTYTKVGRQVTVWGSIAITNNGTGAGAITFAGLPFTNSTVRKTGVGWNQSAATTLAAFANSAVTTGAVWRYDAAYPVATGESFVFTISYSV